MYQKARWALLKHLHFYPRCSGISGSIGVFLTCALITVVVQGELAGLTLAALPSSQVAELSQHGSRKGQMLSETFALTAETGSYQSMAPEVFWHEAYNHKVI